MMFTRDKILTVFNRVKKGLLRFVPILIFVPTAAFATNPFMWNEIVLPASSGAACSDGSPAKFFVNPNPLSSNVVVIFEGGGACWDQSKCSGGSILGASNPKGVSDNYMTQLGSGTQLGLVTPFSARLDVFGQVQTQSWNMVYIPYCTGDVHGGNKVAVYADSDPSNPKVEYHRGDVNSKAIANWLSQNMRYTNKLLVTGASAGGAGATMQYPAIRSALQPISAALYADAGPLFPGPKNGDISKYPSLPMQNTIRSAWGLDLPTGIIAQYAKLFPGLIDPNDLGSITTGLAKYYPNDRFGYSTFQEDGIFSAFSYDSVYPEFANIPLYLQAVWNNQKWRIDLANYTRSIDQAPSNVGYYIPYGRALLKSHTLSNLTFDGTGIDEANIPSVTAFVDNLLDPTKTVIRKMQVSQTMQSGTFNLWLVSLILSAVGM